MVRLLKVTHPCSDVDPPAFFGLPLGIMLDSPGHRRRDEFLEHNRFPAPPLEGHGHGQCC